MEIRLIARLTLIALGLVVVAAGCGSSSSTTAGSDGDGDQDPSSVPADGSGSHAFDGDWILSTGLIDDTALSPVDGHPITLGIDGGSLTGNAGCNGFDGTISVTEDRMRIGDLAITEMACVDQAAMATESAFVDGLTRATTIELTGGELQLGGGDVALSFAAVAPVPDAPVIGTVWLLDTLIDGPAASSTYVDADPAMLRLDDGDRFTASTGCRDLSGDYTLDGDRLELLFDVDAVACDGPAGLQDAAVLAALRQELTVEVVENRLTLTAADGTGLSYRSEADGS